LAEHIATGKLGEALALAYYLKQEYQLLVRNWRWNKVEIDLILRKANRLVFVEVKTRTTNSPIEAELVLSAAQQSRLISGADHFAQHYPEEMESRFDVITVTLDSNGHSINHFPSALDPQAL
jgi:putative endonuclease